MKHTQYVEWIHLGPCSVLMLGFCHPALSWCSKCCVRHLRSLFHKCLSVRLFYVEHVSQEPFIFSTLHLPCVLKIAQGSAGPSLVWFEPVIHPIAAVSRGGAVGLQAVDRVELVLAVVSNWVFIISLFWHRQTDQLQVPVETTKSLPVWPFVFSVKAQRLLFWKTDYCFIAVMTS